MARASGCRSVRIAGAVVGGGLDSVFLSFGDIAIVAAVATALFATNTGHLVPVGNGIVASRMLDELASCGLIAKRPQ